MRAFVAGATGYVGKAVVRALREVGVETYAHVRPDSSRLKEHRERFEAQGAIVDATAWEENEMAATLGKLQPDLLFCCIGTTRARKKEASDPEAETYEAVDYGLTALLVRACLEAEVSPRFVYVSAVGTSAKAPSAYMQARWRAENYIAHSGLPYTIARPSFISGENREEDRPAERVGAKVADAALGAAALIGFVGLRNRYASLNDEELATALVSWALDADGENRIVEGKQLRGRTLPQISTSR